MAVRSLFRTLQMVAVVRVLGNGPFSIFRIRRVSDPSMVLKMAGTAGLSVRLDRAVLLLRKPCW